VPRFIPLLDASFGFALIWPGASGNELEVLASDACLRQVVLRVKEARRRYTQEVRRGSRLDAAAVEEQARAAGGRILAEHREGWTLELFTPEEERRYLCGMDDMHLFIAQVEGGATVDEAHASLRPLRVRVADQRRPGQTLRQGEWFFVPLEEREARELDEHLARSPAAIKHRRPVGPGARSHVAEELVRLARRDGPRRRARMVERIYARGTISHPDHRPLVLAEWRSVVPNRELGRADRSRVRWID
jgi:hypothetical protein